MFIVSGETGRAGTQGDAISLVGPNDWLSFKNVEAFLQQTIRFDKVDGIKAKFKGLRPKKAKVIKAKADTSKAQKAVTKKKTRVIKKTFVDLQDAGAMMIKKRNKPLSAQQIEDSSEQEND